MIIVIAPLWANNELIRVQDSFDKQPRLVGLYSKMLASL